MSELMTSQGRKARWLADRVGISESHLSRIVSGERGVSESLAKRIADVIQAPLFLAFDFTPVSDSLTEEQEAKAA
ncbi:MAG: helix-turn-helix transcriptional regulator [Thermomicrobiales bacterium]|nr:helix-turn-helix transcriptional regulator [Thermomicrobiales bacterium]